MRVIIDGVEQTEGGHLVNPDIDNPDITGGSIAGTTGVVLDTEFNANTIMIATADDTPTPLTVAEQTLVGRKTGGDIDDLSVTDVLTMLGLTDALTYKGATDCSGNPNYPAANAGDFYKVAVAGKIGGASGIVVTAGDSFICTADSTVAGDQATVGAYWNVLQTNIDLASPGDIGQDTPAKGAFTELKASTDPVDEHGVGDTGFYDARYRDVYEILYIDAAEMIPATTSGSLQGTTEWPTNDIDIDQLAFDGGVTPERAQFKIKFPENWDLGTLKAKFDWTGAAGCTAGDTVEWRIKAKAVRDSDAIDAAMGTLQLIVDTVIENDGTDWQTSGATPALTVGGTPAIGCTVLFEIDRNGPGSDIMAEDALLYGISIQYKKSGVVPVWT